MLSFNKSDLSAFVAASVLIASPSGAEEHNGQTQPRLSEQTESQLDAAKDKGQKLWKDTKSSFQNGYLEGKLQTALVLNEHLSPFDLDIDVKDTTAHLAGEVDSDIKKELAGSLALGVDGIEQIDNQIEVVDNPKRVHRSQEDRAFSQYVDDLSTSATIKTELLANEQIKGLDIDVDTFKDNVTLSGRVTSQEQKALVESIVQEKSGVRRVVNQIRVES